MNFIKTKDGSYTLYNEQYREHYHSISGAYEEAREKHVNALDLKNGFKILDFCFGLGYNSFAAVEKYSNLEIIALEKDIEVLEKIKKLTNSPYLSKQFQHFAEIAEKGEIKDNKNNTIKIIIDNVFNSLPKLPSLYFDRVFFDPFSPKKQPELWCKQIFEHIYKILKFKGQLSTYSCAKQVRTNLKDVGFRVKDGPIVGRRSPATIAIKE
mgnify:CR=1 FL=1